MGRYDYQCARYRHTNYRPRRHDFEEPMSRVDVVEDVTVYTSLARSGPSLFCLFLRKPSASLRVTFLFL